MPQAAPASQTPSNNSDLEKGANTDDDSECHPRWFEDEDDLNDPIPVTMHERRGSNQTNITCWQTFVESQDIFDALKTQFRRGTVDFKGEYITPEDAGMTCRERVETTAQSIWDATGYRFTSVLLYPFLK